MFRRPEIQYVYAMLDSLERALDDAGNPRTGARVAAAMAAELEELVPLAESEDERAALGYALRAAAAGIDRLGLALIRQY